MIKIGLELAEADPKYDDMAAVFPALRLHCGSLNHVRSAANTPICSTTPTVLLRRHPFEIRFVRASKVRSSGVMPIFAVETIAMEAVSGRAGSLASGSNGSSSIIRSWTQVSPTSAAIEEIAARAEAPVESMLERRTTAISFPGDRKASPPASLYAR
jgi:hypothetical protein